MAGEPLEPLDVDLDAWDAWSPAEVAENLTGVTAPWCVAAGWALDLFLGRQTREHDDLEIGVPAQGFAEVRDALAGFDFVVIGDARLAADGGVARDLPTDLGSRAGWPVAGRRDA